ncbi:MAG: hypothetical protein ACYTGX_14460 [Planctomycetota bacterium]|jgi:hypothetical protein
MRCAALLLAVLALGCGSADPAEKSPSEDPAAAEVESALREAEEDRRSAGPVLSPREPQFVPLETERLQAMVEFLPGWKLACSDHFALLHQVSDARAEELLQVAEAKTLAEFRRDPRASEVQTPLLRCVAGRAEYLKAGGASDAPALFSFERNEIVLWDEGGAGAATPNVLRDAIATWFTETSPREIEKKVKWLQEWARRRDARGR